MDYRNQLQIPDNGFGWVNLRAFTKWWWASGQPIDPPEDCVKVCFGSHEFVMFRHLQYQVEQVTLMAGHPVPAHCHPSVRTYESHLTGSGVAELEDEAGSWRALRREPDRKHHPRFRMLMIEAGQYHRGKADTDTVALSFQQWLYSVEPDFITSNWLQPDGWSWGR